MKSPPGGAWTGSDSKRRLNTATTGSVVTYLHITINNFLIWVCEISKNELYYA